MIASGMSTIVFLAIWLSFATPPPSIFSCLYFHGAKPPSFILIRAALELGSDEKSVRAHRLKIDPKFGQIWPFRDLPQNGRFGSFFEKSSRLRFHGTPYP